MISIERKSGTRRDGTGRGGADFEPEMNVHVDILEEPSVFVEMHERGRAEKDSGRNLADGLIEKAWRVHWSTREQARGVRMDAVRN